MRLFILFAAQKSIIREDAWLGAQNNPKNRPQEHKSAAKDSTRIYIGSGVKQQALRP